MYLISSFVLSGTITIPLLLLLLLGLLLLLLLDLIFRSLLSLSLSSSPLPHPSSTSLPFSAALRRSVTCFITPSCLSANSLAHRVYKTFERLHTSELGIYVKVEVDVLGSPSLIVRRVSVDVKEH